MFDLDGCSGVSIVNSASKMKAVETCKECGHVERYESKSIQQLKCAKCGGVTTINVKSNRKRK